jgi:hypothetical protein
MSEEVRKEPCSSCPYRRDVPSGLWSAHEYDKLYLYDEPTSDQPHGLFMCHATPEFLCNGWAVCHENRGHEYELFALRIARFSGSVDVPPPAVPLFSSGAEAAAHGKAGIEEPSDKTIEVAERLRRKYERLRDA